MALMPGAVHQLVATGPLMVRYDIVCCHTLVGYAPAAAAHFSVKADGTIIQSRDTRYQSAANYQGNHRVIAIENEDHGPRFGTWTGSDVPFLTPEQVESNARIAVWANQEHGVPMVPCPNSLSTSRGIAYHRQGIDGNFGTYAYGGRISGGEHWSTSFGKVCPGDRRIGQVLNNIIPRARILAGLDQEVDMDTVQNGMLVGLDKAIGVTWAKTGRFLGDVVLSMEQTQAAHTAALAALSNDPDITLDELAAVMNTAVAEHTPSAQAVAEALAPLLPDVMTGIPDEQFAALVDAVNDENDRRERARANQEV